MDEIDQAIWSAFRETKTYRDGRRRLDTQRRTADEDRVFMLAELFRPESQFQSLTESGRTETGRPILQPRKEPQPCNPSSSPSTPS